MRYDWSKEENRNDILREYMGMQHRLIISFVAVFFLMLIFGAIGIQSESKFLYGISFGLLLMILVGYPYISVGVYQWETKVNQRYREIVDGADKQADIYEDDDRWHGPGL
jgi:hypothetical protein